MQKDQSKSKFCGTLFFLLLCGTAQATVFDFQALLSGPAESPPNASPGTGFAFVSYNDIAHSLSVAAVFQGLLGVTTISHIHAATAVPFAGAVGVASYPGTFPGFPVGVTAGGYISPPIDLTQTSSFTGAFLTANGGTAAGAEAGLLAALLAGKAYFNIHTTLYPSGEIRGFLTRVPDSSATAPLLVLSLLGILGFARYQRVASA
jgi:hypothetical protein